MGLRRLKEYVAFNALYDAPERKPHPNVHPKTRKNILDFIMNWIKNPDPEHDILWLHSPLGHGKTAVMQKIAELLHDSSSIHHAGNFFFGRGETGRDDEEFLIPTIAYQIALNIPVMREHINQSMILDPLLPEKNMDAQIQHLILDSFHRCSAPLANKPVVIIDGLDECSSAPQRLGSSNEMAKRSASHVTQSCILDIIVRAVSSPHCPLRFIISTRSEFHLKQIFSRQPLCQISRHIELDGDQGINSFGNRTEMMEFLRDGFDEIRVRFSNIMSTIKKPWPSNDDLWELVRKASGQYLFANSVLQFVGSGPESPVNQLKIILKQRHNEKRKAFATMDHGYNQILTICPGLRKHLRRVLRTCAYLHGWEETLTLSTLAEIIGCRAEEVMLSFDGLHALLDTDEYDEMPANIPRSIYLRYYSPSVRVRHISFIEFLLDKKRSGKFRVDADAAQEWLMERADILLADGLYGRIQSPLHQTTLKLIVLLAAADAALDEDLDDNEDGDTGIEHFSHFPRLREFLKIIRENLFSTPDEPGTRFVESIYTVLNIFDTIRHKEPFQSYIPLFYDLLDQAWRKTISFSPRFHKILYSIMTHTNLSPDISTISNALGMPIPETLEILDQYSCLTTPGRQVELLEHFRSFAENESRSGLFYFQYRECWIRAILAHWKELLEETPKFTLDSYGYQQLIKGFYDKPAISDINFSSDLQENSAMSGLIDFVLGVVRSGESVIDKSDYGVDTMALFIKWLIRHQKMLQPAHERYTIFTTKLRAIVKNIGWSQLIHRVFSSYLRPIPAAALVPPFGIERIRHHHTRTRRAVQMYPYILQLAKSTTVPSFKEDMISEISHTTISEFVLHALLAREHSNTGIDEWRTLYVPILINDVQWHYHLSHAMFTEKILLAILTVHHIFSRRQDPTVSDQERMALDIMKQLGRTSFADGVFAWLITHTRQGNLEWWAQGIPGMEGGKSDDNIASALNPAGILKTSSLFKRKKPGSSTPNTANSQVNLPSTPTAASDDGNSEPVAKCLKGARRQASHPTWASHTDVHPL